TSSHATPRTAVRHDQQWTPYSVHSYVETLVLGQTVVADGELTDARPGGLVRGRHPARLG
ncbi:MAG: hypothetical protein K2X97_16860, partial [Mycobacteriaceae bacterium]|nr:hypothetical protein [Mycobacteriaceae bacterium]